MVPTTGWGGCSKKVDLLWFQFGSPRFWSNTQGSGMRKGGKVRIPCAGKDETSKVQAAGGCGRPDTDGGMWKAGRRTRWFICFHPVLKALASGCSLCVSFVLIPYRLLGFPCYDPESYNFSDHDSLGLSQNRGPLFGMGRGWHSRISASMIAPGVRAPPERQAGQTGSLLGMVAGLIFLLWRRGCGGGLKGRILCAIAFHYHNGVSSY